MVYGFLKGLLIVIALLYGTGAYALNISEVLTTPELKQAWVYLEMKDYSRVAEALNECYTYTTETGAACNFIYARALDRQKNYTGAIEAYRKAYMYSTNKDVREEALFRRSELYFDKKYFYESQSGFRQYLKSFPDARNVERAYLYLGRGFDTTNKLSDALQAYEKAGDSDIALYGKANILQRLGRTKEAQEAYKAALQKNSAYMQKSDETRFLYGENLYQTGNTAKAKDVLVLVNNKKYKEKANLIIGIIAADSSKNDIAARYLAAALNTRDRADKGQALLKLARVQLAQGKLPETQITLSELDKFFLSGKDKDERNAIVYELRLKEKKYKEAVELLKSKYEKQLDSKEFINKLEVILNDTLQHNKEQFVELWEGYGKLYMSPPYEKLILQAAGLLKNTGKPYIDALEWISHNSSDEERQKALYELSRIYADMGDKAAAVKYLGQLKQYKVPVDEILRAEAKVFYENQDYKAAYEKLSAIKQLTKDDLPMLRDVLSAAPDKEKALAFYEKVLKTLGSDAGDSMSMAENLYLIGKKTEAVYYYKQVLSKDPSNEWALYRIGTILRDAEGREAIKKLSEGNSPLSKFAKSIIQGQDVNKMLEELK
ncbi:MAG: tetratricopeptide repeat protein [Nitrospirae bacterium]|nr:tetratricopeptide repeat protein [Nitrospirota bacterium]